MHVLHYFKDFFPSKGGVESYIYSLCKELDDVKFTIVTNLIENAVEREKIFRNTEVIRVPPTAVSAQGLSRVKSSFLGSFINSGNRWELFKQLAFYDIAREDNKKKIMESIDFDVLHLHGPSFITSFLQFPFIKFSPKITSYFSKRYLAYNDIDKPTVVTAHGMISRINMLSGNAGFVGEKNVRKIWHEMERHAFDKADKIISVERWVRDVLKEEGYDVVFIPNGADLNVFKPKAKSAAASCLPADVRKKLDFEKRRILFYGRISPERGTDHLFNLLKSINREEFQVLVAGVGKKEVTDKINRLGGAYVGAFDYEKLPDLINSCDFVFNPLDIEGISRITIESMACGKPVVIKEVGDRYPSKNWKNSVLFNSDDELADIFEKLSDKKVAMRIGKNARVTAEEVFDIKEIAGKIKGVYDSVL